ncbi:MAG: DUF4157 domain-containing protein [Verrucomicrobia bacterium]|nr:DUF4157 domain-containing protein [Verrucomicrobiota bacterium]
MSKRLKTGSLKAARKVPAPGVSAPAAVRESVRSPGQELDAATRAKLEPRFGHDFSQVRVHTGGQAADSARAIHAAAYTVGQDVVFGEGKYQPQTQEGQKLLAHELAHTIQQPQSGDGLDSVALADSADASEREAEQAAAGLEGQRPVTVQSRRSLAVQRQPDELSPVPKVDLAESASPLMASAIGSTTIDGFDTGKAIIPPGKRAELAKTARNIRLLLDRYPASVVRVIGHTDAVGKENDNLQLGQDRADAVQAALVGLGIPAQAIQTESKGETQLLVQTQHAEPRNRRVQVRFQTNPHRFPKLIPDLTLSPPGTGEPKFSGLFQPQPPPKLPTYYTDPLTKPPYQSPDTGSNLPPWFWKPLPKGPAKPGFSIDEVLDSISKKITSFLPKSIQSTAQGLVKSAIEKGITSTLDAGLKQIGVDDKGRQAIGKATEAAIKQKFGGSP